MPESAPAIAAPPTVSRPDPDPTTLTTQALYREINQVHDLINSETYAVSSGLSARLDGADRERLHLQAEIDALPTEVTRRIDTLQHLHQEKFNSIQVQFSERDTRTEQTSRDSKVAVDAALQAAKEAVEKQNASSALAIAKSESATTKQIDTQGILITTATTSLNERIDAASATMNSKIDDLKDRLNRMEGMGLGTRTTHEDNRGLIAVSIAVLSVLFNIVIYLVAHH